MEKAQIIDALDALAQESRLDLFRLLVRAGPQGMTPSTLSRQLKIAPPTLSFHLGRLAHAGLVTSRRRGRSIAYTPAPGTIDELIGFLNANVRTVAPPPEKPTGERPANDKAAPEKPAGEKPANDKAAPEKAAKDGAAETKRAEPASAEAPAPKKTEAHGAEAARQPEPDTNRKAAEPTA